MASDAALQGLNKCKNVPDAPTRTERECFNGEGECELTEGRRGGRAPELGSSLEAMVTRSRVD